MTTMEQQGLKKTSERRTVTERIDTVHWDLDGMNCADLIAWAQRMEDAHPGFKLDWESGYDSDPHLWLVVVRPETDAEYGARIAQENVALLGTERRELAELARLKAKYEGK